MAQMLDASVQPFSTGHLFLTTAASCALWVPLTVGIAQLCARFPLFGAQWRRHAIVHVLGCIGIILLRAALIDVLNPFVHWYAAPPATGALLLTSIDHNLLVYWTFVGIFHALASARAHFQRDLAESSLRTALARAELAVLKSQLQPHFMANSLQTVAELIHRDAALAERVVVALGELLRQALNMQRHDLVHVADEVDFLACYFDIERARFGHRLRVAWQLDPTTMTLAIPALITQPLVENAIRHGVAAAAGGEIKIQTQRTGGMLQICIADCRENGPSTDHVSQPTASRFGRGQGLNNVRARLSAQFGAHAQLHVEASALGTSATLLMPILRHLPHENPT
jgi:LytS/YehU family sensor histidine kinase